MDESPGELIKPAAGRVGWTREMEVKERVDSRHKVFSKHTGIDIRGLSEAG